MPPSERVTPTKCSVFLLLNTSTNRELTSQSFTSLPNSRYQKDKRALCNVLSPRSFTPSLNQARKPLQLHGGLSRRKTVFDPEQVHVRPVVDEVELGQVFLPGLRFSPVNIIPTMLHSNINLNSTVIRRTSGGHVQSNGLQDITTALYGKLLLYHA